MGILSDFYTGRLAPFENFNCSDIPQVVELHDQIKRTESELLKTLSEEQQVAYNKIREYRLQTSVIELEEMFKYAYKIGVQMGQEIFDGE